MSGAFFFEHVVTIVESDPKHSQSSSTTSQTKTTKSS